MKKIKNIDILKIFGKVYTASGVRGIDGKGYWYDKFLHLVPGYNFANATFITKTVTVDARNGNLPLKPNLQPIQKIPKCIKVYPFSGAMLNAVGVSSPGLKTVLDMNIWQQRTTSFLISIIPVRDTFEQRIEEMKIATNLIKSYLSSFQAPIAIQLNVSCPNVYKINYKEIISYIEVFKNEDFLVDLKVNILMPYDAKKVFNLCDMITCSNTIPYGSFPDQISWNKYNALLRFGGGGLSGTPLLPFVIDWISKARSYINVPLKACGGIMHAKDVNKLICAGANAIEIGTVKLLRPWRVKSIVNHISFQ